MITVKLPTSRKSKAFGCLYPIVRELISGLGAVSLFSFLSIPIFIKDILDGSEKSFLWLLAFLLSLAAYFGIRFGISLIFNLLFPDLYKKVQVELPEGLAEDTFTVFLSACAENLALLRKDAKAIQQVAFQQSVLHLCDLGDDLLINFEKDPRDVQAAQELPDRLQRLHEILTGYLELTGQRSQSPQTLRAIRDTEKAVTKAVGKFEQIHHRLLENDAIDLSTSAKTLDNLLDFD